MLRHLWRNRSARADARDTRFSAIAFVAAAALGCCVTVAALCVPDTAESRRSLATGAPAVGSIELVATTPLPGQPTGLAVSRTQVGVSLALDGVTFVRRDDASRSRRIRIDGAATSIHTDGSRFWVADMLHDRVLKLDEAGSVLGEFRVGGLPGGIALTRSDVWVLGLEEPSITLADRRNQLPVVHLSFGAGELWPRAIASGPHGVWISTGHRAAVTLMDAEGYVTRGKVAVRGVDRLTTTPQGVWAARQGPGPELARIDGSTLRVQTRDLPGQLRVTAIDAGSILAVAVRGAVLGLDPKTGVRRARAVIDADCELTHVAVDGDDIWAVDATHNELLRFHLRLPSAHRDGRGG